MQLQKVKLKKKPKKIEVRDYMLARGLQPTPLEFYKMLINSGDNKYDDFFCYCKRKADFYDFEVVPFA